MEEPANKNDLKETALPSEVKPSTDNIAPKCTTFLIDMELPNCKLSSADTAEPKRKKLRKESVLPSVARPNSDSEYLTVVTPKTENTEPRFIRPLMDSELPK